MRTYHKEENVPWGDILQILGWYLTMKIRSIRHALEREDFRAVELDLPDLQMAYDSQRKLRRFLGYSGETRPAREARELLEKKAQER
jgi:hypothetical protein